MQTKELFTRKRHNEGTPIDVRDEVGKVVGWIRIRGLDSDAYRTANDAYNRAMVRLAAAVRAKADAPLLAETQAEKAAAQLAERVALVAAWSFETPCTEASITELLTEAPRLSDQVYYTACDRDRFLEHSSRNFSGVSVRASSSSH